MVAGVATPCCATTTWMFGSAFCCDCGCGRLRRLVIPASLMRCSPGERVDLWATPVQVCLLYFRFLLGYTALFFGDGLGTLQVLNAERHVERNLVRVQVKYAWVSHRCYHQRRHSMAVCIIVMWCEWKREQFFFKFVKVNQVFEVIRFAVGIINTASCRANYFISSRRERFYWISLTDKIL